MTYDTLYARLSNRVTFSAKEVRLLICAATDPRFTGYLLSGSPFIAAARIDHREAIVTHEEFDTAERAVATVPEHVRQFAKKGEFNYAHYQDIWCIQNQY